MRETITAITAPIVTVVGAFMLITAVLCNFGLISADRAGTHPLTFSQVWGIAPHCPMDETCPVLVR
jgi:hypothetical protein